MKAEGMAAQRQNSLLVLQVEECAIRVPSQLKIKEHNTKKRNEQIKEKKAEELANGRSERQHCKKRSRTMTARAVESQMQRPPI